MGVSGKAKVLVIGAGFAGVPLAIELTSKGLDVTLVDRWGQDRADAAATLCGP
jgi:2-polyprenyl-6-methoxyphenol hydroxylase-like FAD-dependent oxidoreductase